jgi:hypothetical protein
MKKTFTFMKIITVFLKRWRRRDTGRAAVTVYADEVPSNADRIAPVAGTNVPRSADEPEHEEPVGTRCADRRDRTVFISADQTASCRHREECPSYCDIPETVDHSGIISSFGMVVAIIALAGYFAHRRNKMAHETMRAMIDKGVPITPELVAEMRSKRHPVWHCAERDGQERSFSRTGPGRGWHGAVDHRARR